MRNSLVRERMLTRPRHGDMPGITQIQQRGLKQRAEVTSVKRTTCLFTNNKETTNPLLIQCQLFMLYS